MLKVHYRLSDGSSLTVTAVPGTSLMQLAVDQGVPGILGRCGGYCNCGTCHVYLDPAWAAALPAPSVEEDTLLSDCAAERRATSRLGCQVKLTQELDGITVTVPSRQEP
jgi:ferredoxin, 2Fe-2S